MSTPRNLTPPADWEDRDDDQGELGGCALRRTQAERALSEVLAFNAQTAPAEEARIWECDYRDRELAVKTCIRIDAARAEVADAEYEWNGLLLRWHAEDR